MNATVSIAVLFTDLVGSTELLSRLGPSAADDLRRDHFATLRSAITAHGGTEVKTLGDGFMITFPSATSAVAGAVAMQQAVEFANRRAAEPLGMRVGIAFGDAEIENGDYFGPPVVEAARLCARAESGGILTTELVRTLVGTRGSHAFESLGALGLKGLDVPVVTYAVGWTPLEAPPDSAIPLPVRLDQRTTLPYTGREAEGRLLDRVLDDATASRRCRAVMVSGEAGVGKTTLVAELARRAVSGAMVLYGRSDEELAVPYQPWVEALRHLVQHADPSVLRAHVVERGGEVARLVPELRLRVPNLVPPQPSDADAERYLLYGAVTSLLARVSATLPVIIVLDDLHWADKPSLQLLRHVVASGEPMRVVIVGTHRDHDLSAQSPLVDLLASFHRESAVERIELDGLADADLIRIFETASGGPIDQVGAEVARSIQRETDGNPFFVTELIRHLQETGGFFQDPDGRWRVDSMLREGTRLPSSVREVVGRRIGRLGEVVAVVLRTAAVIGREFDLGLLAAVTEQSEDALLDTLDRACTAGLVAETATGGAFTFTHALIEHTLYDELGATRRQRLHLRVAEAIEDQCRATPGARVGELAYHYGLATAPVRVSKAFEYARQAGDRAIEDLAPDEAVRWYRQALELCPPADDARRGSVLVGLGTAQRQAGDADFRQTLFDAAAIAQRMGDAKLLVRAALANNRGTVSSVLQVDEERVQVLEAALAAVGPEVSSERARLLGLLSAELMYRFDHEPRQRYAREAIAMARALDDPATFVTVSHLVCAPLLTPENLAKRLALTADTVRLADALGDPALRFTAAFDRVISSAEAGDREQVERHLAQAEAMAAQIADPNLVYFATTLRAGRQLFTGQFTETEETIGKIMEIGTQSNQPDVLQMWGGFSWFLRRDQGRAHEFLDAFLQLIAAAPAERPDPQNHARVALVYVELGRLEDAALHAAIARSHRGSYDTVWAVHHGVCVEIAAALGDRAWMSELQRDLAPFGENVLIAGQFSLGSVHHYLGLAAATLGDVREAAAHFASALAVEERMGAPVWGARTRVGWADLLQRHGTVDDRAHARTLAGEARAVAERLGAAVVARDAAAVLARLA